jgi:acyl carrier protein
MYNEIEKKLKQLIMDCGENINVEQITDTTHLLRDLNYNSISVIQLVVALESTFDIEIDDDDLLIEKLAVYTSLLNMLEKKLQEKAQTE